MNSSQPYINYEEELLAEEGERCRGAGNSEYDCAQKKDNDHRKKDKSQTGISLIVEWEIMWYNYKTLKLFNS